MLSSIYIVIFLVLNSFFNLADSIIFLFVPIPISIYTYKFGFKYGFMCLIVVTIFSLLLNLINGLFFVLPNLLIGVVFGNLYKSKKVNKILVILITLVLAFIFDFLATYQLAYVVGINNMYEINNLAKLLNTLFKIDIKIAEKIITNVIPTVYIIIAILKTILIVLIDEIILSKLGLKESFKLKTIKFSRTNGILYFIAILLFVVALFFVSQPSKLFLIILYNLIFVIFILYSLLIYSQLMNFYALIFISRGKVKTYYVLAILSIILFPIGIIMGVVINFIDIKKLILKMRI